MGVLTDGDDDHHGCAIMCYCSQISKTCELTNGCATCTSSVFLQHNVLWCSMHSRYALVVSITSFSRSLQQRIALEVSWIVNGSLAKGRRPKDFNFNDEG